MKNFDLAGTLLLTLLAFAGSLAAVAQEPDLLAIPDKAALPFRLKDQLIEKAVRETLAESKEDGKERAVYAARPAPGTDKYEAFGRQFSEAQKPSCLGPDALRHQPNVFTVGGFNFGFGGVFALPFLGTAIVRGKCN